MKLIRKFLLLSVLLVFGGCIAMEEIQKAKERFFEDKKSFFERKKKFQDEIDKIDLKLQVETNVAERERLLATRKIKIDFELPSLDSYEADIQAREDFLKTLEMQEQVNQQQAQQRLAEIREEGKQRQAKIQEQYRQKIEKMNRQTKLRRQQIKKERAKLVNTIKLLGAFLPILYICVYSIYKLYKHCTAKKEDPVIDENDNDEEDLQEAFFVEENTEY